MPKMTLTEALAQYKLTLAKIDKKVQEISHYTVRDERLVDPLAKSMTTSSAFIEQEQQAINDLSNYAIRLKSAIAKKNKEVKVKVNGMDMTIEEAIVWRRDVFPRMSSMYNGMLHQARKAREDAARRGANDSAKVVINFDEKGTMEALAAITEANGTLDTQLSIANATVMVEV